MVDLVFYTNPMSRGQTARWMLEEVGEPYETRVLDYGTTMKGQEYLAVNPMGKVPAIVHKGRVVTEVAAICCYLADAFPDKGLAPPIAERADYYRWIFFTSGPIEAAFSNKAAGWEPTPEKQRMFGYGNYDLAIGTLEKAVAGTNISLPTISPPPTCSSAPTSISCCSSTCSTRSRPLSIMRGA